jgi:hypothetical protein
MAKYMSLEGRFLQKTTKTDSCWLWTGALNSQGYGSIGVNGKSVSAHRFSYELYVGEIPAGMVVCHSCDVRHCVNPEHLWVGTTADNNRDMFTKDRNGSSSRKRTHCRRGHSFDEFGVYEKQRKNGTVDRICRECKRIAAKNMRTNPETREAYLQYQREYQRKYQRRKK